MDEAQATAVEVMVVSYHNGGTPQRMEAATVMDVIEQVGITAYPNETKMFVNGDPAELNQSLETNDVVNFQRPKTGSGS